LACSAGESSICAELPTSWRGGCGALNNRTDAACGVRNLVAGKLETRGTIRALLDDDATVRAHERALKLVRRCIIFSVISCSKRKTVVPPTDSESHSLMKDLEDHKDTTHE
jgi:hypothetical protein